MASVMPMSTRETPQACPARAPPRAAGLQAAPADGGGARPAGRRQKAVCIS